VGLNAAGVPTNANGVALPTTNYADTFQVTLDADIEILDRRPDDARAGNDLARVAQGGAVGEGGRVVDQNKAPGQVPVGLNAAGVPTNANGVALPTTQMMLAPATIWLVSRRAAL
jgi:hypothetical protein